MQIRLDTMEGRKSDVEMIDRETTGPIISSRAHHSRLCHAARKCRGVASTLSIIEVGDSTASHQMYQCSPNHLPPKPHVRPTIVQFEHKQYNITLWSLSSTYSLTSFDNDPF